jgi:hypothetical protein
MTKNRNHQSRHVQRLLVIVDVIQQLLAKRFIAHNGNYILAETYNSLLGNQDPKTVNSQTIRENANHIQKCEVCAKGAVLLAFIQRFNSVDGAHLSGCLSNGGIERHVPQLSQLFSHDLLGEIEAAFEGGWYVTPEKEQTEADRNKVYQWRRETLQRICGSPYMSDDRTTDEYKRVSTELMLAIMHKLIDGNGTKLII